jgi:hypothetical protein
MAKITESLGRPVKIVATLKPVHHANAEPDLHWVS